MFKFRIMRLNPRDPGIPEWLVVDETNTVIGMHDDWNKANRQVYDLEHTEISKPKD